MRSFRTAFPSKFLKADDLATGSIVATIAQVDFEDVGQGEKTERKLVVQFKDGVKAIVLNVVNSESIAEITGTEDIDAWPGVALELYKDKTFFNGKRVPCVRIRKPAAGRRASAQRDQVDDAMPTIEVEV